MAKSTIVFVKGTLYWPKIVGKQALVSNYDGDGREWTFELEPEDIQFLKDNRLLDRLKDPMAYANKLQKQYDDYGDEEVLEKLEKAKSSAEGRGNYLMIRKPELTKSGEENDPFRIYDDQNEPWGDERLIGNGSKADCKLKIVNWGPGKKSSIYCMALRITDHVSYESDEFAAMDRGKESPKKDSPAKAKAKPKTKKTAVELDMDDDDIPF